MIFIPLGILIFGLGLICGIRLSQWAIRHRLKRRELLRRYEEYS